MSITLDHLRHFAVANSLFPPVTLPRALAALGFVQADPIRAPARAQDLTLRLRVVKYRAGDLERRYQTLSVEEDFFINYGFVTTEVQALMHPRVGIRAWPGKRRRDAIALLEFVRARGDAHPRDVDRQFSLGRVANYWSGSSSATTQLLGLMQYHGLLRVARRDAGVRVYAVRTPAPGDPGDARCATKIDALVDVLVRKYAPLPASSLSHLVGRLRYGVPQWRAELKGALDRAKRRLRRAPVGGVDWYWPAEGRLESAEPRDDRVRLLAPFDPVVWDRRRFELLWNWPYRFEAYTPAPKRKRGYYALPLLWRNHVIGWANLEVRDGELHTDVGYVAARPPRGPLFRRELEAELDRMRAFLDLGHARLDV